jgi:hypothetical protein
MHDITMRSAVGYVSVDTRQQSVPESQQPVIVCWSLSPPELSVEREGQVLFTLSTISDTATMSDFGSIEAEAILLLSTAPTSLCVNVTVFEDRVIESQESFFVMLSSEDSAVHFNPDSNTTQVSWWVSMGKEGEEDGKKGEEL